MELGLETRRILVCGASKGLGYAVAEALVREDAELILVSRDDARLEEAKLQLLKTNPDAQITTIKADLTDAEQREALVKKIRDSGPLDGIVHNTGGPAPSQAAVTTSEAWEKGFRSLFLSVVELNQAFIPSMRERKWGRVITLTSLSAVEPIEFLAVSNAMRAALSGYCKTLAAEVAADGVTVNLVMPGVIHTGRIEELRRAKAERSGTTLESEIAATAKAIPAGRLGRPEELGALVAFLLSEKASYITGANIPVDGGMRKAWA